jgi:hypothetical protein
MLEKQQMIALRRDILREAIIICRQSNLYDVFTREEKRETVRHIYNIIDRYQLVNKKTPENIGEFNPVSIEI